MSLRSFVLILSAIAIAGCKPAVQSSDVAHEITKVAQSKPKPTAIHAEIQFVGRNSCSATACHGQPQTTPITWRNAHQIFEATDPHRRAFDVLYTERSVRIYRLLTEDESTSIDDKIYLQFLEHKCIGCHATSPQGTKSIGGPEQQSSPEVYWQGVSCESCHGPASHWLGTHYSQAWPESHTERESQSANGFQDMRSLHERGAVCANCHHGPKEVGKNVYDVDHDLIAVGHPRLRFEFHAYLANLPKHWSEQDEIKRQPLELAASFHFNTWQIGQSRLIAQDKHLKALRAEKLGTAELNGWAEFANHDCRQCHHIPAEPNFRLASRQADKQEKTEMFANVSVTPTKAERATVLLKFLELSRRSHSSGLLPSSDQAVDIYLAATAFAHDFPQEPPFDSARLQKLLTQQAGRNQYSLPTDFNPEQPELKQALNDLQKALEILARP